MGAKPTSCVKCFELLTEDNAVACQYCSAGYHSYCADLSLRLVREGHWMTYHWVCPKCLEKKQRLYTVARSGLYAERLLEGMETMQREVAELNDKLSRMEETLKRLEERLN
ncbi:hypothetical protein J6590_059787 [Homalodisca vitripennis]|nr:hypothetical protein J6590_059785 [Homalodisca vitripennis]KAG8271554.1 hypothetical protein J6590_059787 [Homalodisca vitripennis]